MSMFDVGVSELLEVSGANWVRVTVQNRSAKRGFRPPPDVVWQFFRDSPEESDHGSGTYEEFVVACEQFKGEL